MQTTLLTELTVKEICEGFVYNQLEGKGLFGWSGKLTIQPEYQRNYIYAENDGRRLYLIELMQKGHRSLCKGHMEEDESEHQTAEREILEETGLKVEFLDGFRETIEYSPYDGCMKTVVFFLAKADTTDVAVQEEEVREISWLPFEEALEALTFESAKESL